MRRGSANLSCFTTFETRRNCIFSPDLLILFVISLEHKGCHIRIAAHHIRLPSEGYLWEKVQWGRLDVDALEKDFVRMIDFWKSIYPP